MGIYLKKGDRIRKATGHHLIATLKAEGWKETDERPEPRTKPTRKYWTEYNFRNGY